MNAMTRTTITSRAPVAARRAVVVRAQSNAQDKRESASTTQETRRQFARNAALLAAAAFVSVAGNNQAHADEVPEKLKKKICANNATAKLCIK